MDVQDVEKAMAQLSRTNPRVYDDGDLLENPATKIYVQLLFILCVIFFTKARQTRLIERFISQKIDKALAGNQWQKGALLRLKKKIFNNVS